MWSCDTCGRPNHRNPLICETCGAAAPGASPDAVNMALQRDLAMESHFRGLAFWYRVGAILAGVTFLAAFGLMGSLFMGLGRGSLHGTNALMAGAFGYVAFFVLAFVAGSYVLGHFLARFSNGARIAAAVLTMFGLVGEVARFVLTCMAYSRVAELYADTSYYASGPSLLGPIVLFILSVMWCLAILVTLLSSRARQVCAPAYRTIVARTAQMRASLWKTPFFVIPLVGSSLVALFMMRLLFMVRGYSSY
ncbi:MAG TPA: hypothetical protein VN947_24170 [Polyangia bacterium]|nr:hypothetical protein [Polyangia bacterium]